MTTLIQHYVDGQEWKGEGPRSGDIYNPALGTISAKVEFANTGDVNKVVEIAAKAFQTWSEVPPAKRARIMIEFYNLLNRRHRDIAMAITQEHGKTIEDAMGEVKRGIEVVEYAISAPEVLKGQHSENVGTNIDTKSIRYPLGVVAGITPFNFPAMIPLWMSPMAIVCGNTFVLKPSEKDPTAAMIIADLYKQAGLPNGVFNVVHGDKEAVDALLTHPEIQAVSFVGSTPIAKYVYETGAANGKRVQALGGAKNHMVVMPDADLDATVSGLMGAAYGSAGERCMAISLAVAVGDEVGDALKARLTPLVEGLRIGNGQETGLDMGPLVSAAHRDKVRSYVDLGVEEGADLVVDGRPFMDKNLDSGYFMGGCLFDNVTPDMRIYKEEIFGPVLGIVRVKTYGEAVELINNHEFGNGVSIYTQNGRIGRDFYSRIKVGMVGVNVPVPVPVAYHSFGGWKASLFGDHHMHGPEGIRFYTRLKAVTIRWPTGAQEPAEFSMPVID